MLAPLSVHESHELVVWRTPNAGGCHVNNHLSHINRPFNESGISAGRCTASADSASSSSAESGLIPDEVGLIPDEVGLIPDEVGLHRVVGHHRLVEV